VPANQWLQGLRHLSIVACAVPRRRVRYFFKGF
jgi:hypothetical protein